MSSTDLPSYCPYCDEIVTPLRPAHPESPLAAGCPKCNSRTVRLDPDSPFPLGPPLALPIFTAVARALVRAGALPFLEAQAAATTDPLRKDTCRALATLLRTGAML